MIRKLTQKEHGRTRQLWEEVFSEDSEAFLDYYYSEVTLQNEIYVVEAKAGEGVLTDQTGTQICAMLHLNPFLVKAGSYCGKADYIVAVATRRPYRGRGYMAELLKAACRDMYRERLPFTFLMPAAEAIYHPHGFRFIYRQKRGWITAEDRHPEITCESMNETECRAAAELAEKLLKDRDVYTRRSVSYYRRLRKEQISENGGVLLLKEAGELKGILCYASDGDRVEMREPLLAVPRTEWGVWLSQAAYALTGAAGQKVFCEGYGEEEAKPVIMARVVCLSAFFACFTAGERIDGMVTVSDPMLEENNGIWHISAQKGQPLRAVKLESNTEEGGVIRAAQLTDGMEPKNKKQCMGRRFSGAGQQDTPVPVSMLTVCLSGNRSAEEAAADEHIVLSEETRELLNRIQPWKHVFINEIV